MQIHYHKNFKKSYQKLHKKIQLRVQETVRLFRIDVFDPSLHNHALNGKRLGCRSIDVTGDLRIIIRETSKGTYEIVELLEVGTHSQLY